MWQLIYTSAPRGLVSGQSGFCTVARSADLRDALAQRLEQISSYHYLELPGAGSTPRNPIISAYRVLDIRGAKYHTLTRIRPCGLDFTARTNHLAQHLAFQPDELALLPSPAAVLRHWNGWLSQWKSEPRLLDPITCEAFKAVPPPSWPAKEWLRLTGDAGRAAGLLEGECVRGCYLLCPAGGEEELLDLFCETLQLPNYTGKYPARAWQHPFTTFLQAEDALADFQWRGCQAGTPAYRQAVNRAAPILQLRNLRVPASLSAKLAREGPPTSGGVTPAGASSTPLTLRKQTDAPAPPPPYDFSNSKFRHRIEHKTRPPGLNIPLSPGSLRAIGIAVALLSVVLLAFFLSRHSRHTLPEVAPGPPAAPGSPITGSKPPPPSREPVPDLGLRAPRADPDQLNQELADKLEDAQTFLIVVNALASTNSLTVSGIGPLGGLLRNFNQIKYHPNDVEAELVLDRWGSGGGASLQLESSPRGGGGSLTGTTSAGESVVFDYSDLGNGQPLRIQTQFKRSPRAFSIVFRPARTEAKLFESFRLLVVNDANSPPALHLSNHFLFAGPINRDPLAMLEEPLSKRLRWICPMDKVARAAAWQLRPFVKTRESTDPQDLWRDWLKRSPGPGEELDLAALRKGLTAELERLTNAAAMYDNQLSDLAAGTPTNVDLALPLGTWLGVTNSELASFAAYTNRPGPLHISTNLYLTYLRSISSMAQTEHHWLPKPDSVEWLPQLYEKCKHHLPHHNGDYLTLAGPITNYFLAAMRCLEAAESRDDLLKRKAQTDPQVQRLRRQLDPIPAAWDQTAFLTLNLLGPDRPLEVIRFSDFSNRN